TRGQSRYCAIHCPSPRLDATRTSRRAGSSGIASAASTTREPSVSTPARAIRDRPNASTVSTCSNREHSASTVPSPPSATGIAVASTPTEANPSVSASAAAVALSEPLRLAGHASALGLTLGRPFRLRLGRLLVFLLVVGGDRARHLA